MKFFNTKKAYLIIGVISLFIIVFTRVIIAQSPLENPENISWIGNSFGGGNKWVQLQISALYVTPKGICFTNSPWDESGREGGIYQNGDVIGKAQALHGWGRAGGIAVTANSNYLYVAMKQNYIPKDW